MRTSEGLGLCAAHVVPNAEGDLGAHRRIAQDADKWIDVAPHQSGPAAVQALAERGFAVFAGHLDAKPLPPEALPDPARLPGWVRAEFLPRGGHAGFIEGGRPWRVHSWAERRALDFLDAALAEPPRVC